MMRDDVTRGTTRVVKTLHAVSTTMAMPATSATRRANSTSVILPDRDQAPAPGHQVSARRDRRPSCR